MPYFDKGPTDIANGLILRNDLHKLFDDLKIMLTMEDNKVKINIHYSVMSQVDYKDFDGLVVEKPSYANVDFLKERIEDTKKYWDKEN